ncbi:E3 ubiquitin-protein ligase TRIM33-like [Ruditapes philippinarum]|uniref:E3 ubiquitin-protein ligase TRIM33-like n=1 Tax=Ruditapes philippinarum TaxID=129788 RepID=UPI00295A6669|nr:E3 ubiquitin-protein ligase TRIM33-like [Ruditapes philippinarum]
MAVSGRKQVDLLGSVAAGSAEDFDHCCEPCLTTGQHIEAHGFCVTCQEYLCKNCHDVHRKTKVLRNHQILQRNDFDKIQTTRKSYNECTEMCQVHKKEIIKFYCPSHHALGCNDCITLGHRTCKVDYIPEKCLGVADGKEFDDVMHKLGEKLKEASEISKKAKGSRSNINDYNKEIIKAITEFRKEINDRLDLMQKDALDNAEKIKSNTNKIIQHVLDTCENMISGIKCLQSSLHASKSNHEHCQLYIDMKRAESTLKSDELHEEKETLMHTNMHFSFQRNSELETFFCKKMIFGEIVDHSRYESTKGTKAVDRLIGKGDINVKTSSDTKECVISGCAVLNTNKLVLADSDNNKVKLISIENRLVQEEKALASRPIDIAVMSQDQFAVTNAIKNHEIGFVMNNRRQKLSMLSAVFKVE